MIDLIVCAQIGLLFRLVLLGPAHPSRDAFHSDHVLVAFMRAEIINGSIGLDKHTPRPRLNVGATERAGTFCNHFPHLIFNFLASRAVSLSMRMSPFWTGPMTFRVMIRPLSRPSKTRTFTCIASPVIPVRPMSSTTSAGIPSMIGSPPDRDQFLRLPIYFFSMVSIFFARSSITILALPGFVIATAAVGTSSPDTLPSSVLLGT